MSKGMKVSGEVWAA